MFLPDQVIILQYPVECIGDVSTYAGAHTHIPTVAIVSTTLSTFDLCILVVISIVLIIIL
jgi:hypothetical protein